MTVEVPFFSEAQRISCRSSRSLPAFEGLGVYDNLVSFAKGRTLGSTKFFVQSSQLVLLPLGFPSGGRFGRFI